MGPVERKHHHADEETWSDQSCCHQDGPGMCEVDIRGHDYVQGRRVEVDRDLEDSYGRKDLRGGGESQVDSQVSQDARTRWSNCQSRSHNARITSKGSFNKNVTLNWGRQIVTETFLHFKTQKIYKLDFWTSHVIE